MVPVYRTYSRRSIGLTGVFCGIFYALLQALHLANGGFANYQLNRDAVTYEGYAKQCGYQLKCHGDNSCPSLNELGSLGKDALEKAIFELLNNEAVSNDPRFLIDLSEFDAEFHKTKPIHPNEQLGVTRTLTTHKVLEALTKKYSCCQLRNLLDGKCYPNVTLPCCYGSEEIFCDPYYPYRSYDGSCNNLQHPTWGKRGNALKHPIAPCYSDLVSTPARSKSGTSLPQNRKLLSGLADVLRKREINFVSNLNMASVFLSEFINSDMIGRANRRTKRSVNGFRGCLADGSDRSPFVTALSNPLLVSPNDRYFGPLGVQCLNLSPQEKANDKCELKHVAERNMESSYLDLSSTYSESATYDESGRLDLQQCGATAPIINSEPISVQFFAIAGLFGKLHNYCVDRASTCLQSPGPVAERCRAFTIGVYQKIIFEQLLPVLFGEEFYDTCNLNCKYNPHDESVVSMAYRNGLGRFQHVWITETMKYKPQGQSQTLPFNTFFHQHERFDCSGVLDGVLETPIHIGNLSSANMDKFYTVNGERGTCLPCIDLSRNRDSGLCPLLTYKHYLEQLIGEETKCYNTFEDLRDMFSDDVIEYFAKRFEHPNDIDLLFGIFDKRFVPGGKLPRIVAQATCLEFKRLKCTDRFFYKWNPYLGEGARHLINVLDFTSLLAQFTEMHDVPVEPFFVDSPRVATSSVRDYMQTLDYLFCYL
ncbi:chorion peroxidase-like [Anopheles maculipalpis]|uniref:chorion peroxidase-like n=1 Tax=Anopheles maculipalpis TaxID=1496333 RepID=UPI00215963B6|nr:chorion peroxidase-like [Anopheles maculipalpis]